MTPHGSAEIDLFIPDGAPPEAALARTTHLCVAAHQDDVEILAWHGIRACLHAPDLWFTGVVVTDGAGSPRTGAYAAVSDAEMMRIRREEQRAAAVVGRYGAMVQLLHPSARVKSGDPRVADDLARLLERTRPDTVYLHNPADKHDTHVAVFLRSLEALRRLPAADRPRRVYGCEVWRSLDWLPDAEKTILPHDDAGHIASALLAVFDSQISGGKRYDLAVAGRRLANATLHRPNDPDDHAAATFALDLTPLVADDSADVAAFTAARIDALRADVLDRLARMGG